MAIKSNIGQNSTAVAASSTDTVLLADLGVNNRSVVTGLSIFNTTGGNIAIDLYESPDNTSASGMKIGTYTIATLASVQPVEIIGQGYASGRRLIGRVTTAAISSGDLNFKLTYTLYNAGS